MNPTRFLARPMLAGVFVASGIDVLRNPEPRVAKAETVAPKLAEKVGLPQDTELLVKINAATHVVAGTLLALGKLRRLSALALLGSMVPTTYAGHRFWEIDEPRQKSEQQVHFLKNLAIAGGLLLEVVDTQGKPSLGWRSERALRRAAQAAAASGVVAGGAARATKGAAALKAADAARGAAGRVTRDLGESAAKAKVLKDVAGKVADSAKAVDGARAKELAASARDLAGKAGKAKVLTAAVGRVTP